MTDKNSAPAPSPDENGSNRHLERVVDELRMVLSDLGHTPKKSDGVDSGFTEKKPSSKNPLDSKPEPGLFPTTKADAPSAATPVSSDADFWNGNVLGWPNGADKSGRTENHREEAFSDPLNALPEVNNQPPEPANDLTMKDPIDAMNMESDPDMPLPMDNLAPVISSFNPNTLDDTPPWNAENPLTNPGQLPDAPLSPLESAMAAPTPSMPAEDASNPFSPTFVPFQEPVEPRTAAAAPAPPVESPVPIPQTIHKKPEPSKPVDPNLNLEAPDLKPKGLVQIACIYPEGQEKLGQTFVSKLRETGEKSKKTLNLQAVFVHPWTSDKVDIAAWKKSAVLSGADIMFVLVSKGNAASLKTLGSDGGSEIKCRAVYLEQVSMRALYADIVVELQRGK